MSTDANDVLFGSGIPAAKFQYPGETFAGPITKLEAVQARKFDKKTNRPTDELETWDNGDPKMVAVATLRTDHRDPADPSDDGQRKLYIASRDMQTKVREAVKAAGQRKLDLGAYLRVTYTHEAPSEAGPMAKFYEVEYQPASAAAANQALGGGPVGQGQIVPPGSYGQPIQQMPYPVQQPTYPAAGSVFPQQQQPQYAQQPQAQVPGIGQMLGQGPAQPVQATNVAAPAPAAASGAADLDSLPPEARALVERMLAGQAQV